MLTRRHLIGILAALFVVGGLGSGLFSLAATPNVVAAARFSSLSIPVVTSPLSIGAVLEQASRPERTTVLLMGLDRRPVDDPDAPSRSDALLVATVDAARSTVSVLSIPRDLWVPIPLSEERVVQERINAAYPIGETEGYPGGGPALVKATVEYNFGIRIHYYAVLDFVAFERFIDTIGGIEMNLPEPLVNPSYPTANYGTMPITISAGRQRLDGERALWYVRSRYLSSDFERMQRQQQLALAMRAQLLRLNTLPRLPQLWAEHQDIVHTDISFLDALNLARIALSVPEDRIKARTLELGYVNRGAVAGDSFLLVPDRNRIRQLIAELFPEESS